MRGLGNNIFELFHDHNNAPPARLATDLEAAVQETREQIREFSPESGEDILDITQGNLNATLWQITPPSALDTLSLQWWGKMSPYLTPHRRHLPRRTDRWGVTGWQLDQWMD
jgi:hypothetical protein